MRKYYIISLVVSVFFSCDNSIDKHLENDLTKLQLKGNVKSIIETDYKFEEKFGQIQTIPENNKKEYYFNKKGFYTKSKESNYSGSFYVYEYTYNKDNLVEIGCYHSNGDLKWKKLYKYDNNNNLVELNSYRSDEVLYDKVTYFYNENGVMIEEINYTSDGKIDSKINYDNFGNELKRVRYDSIKNIIHQISYKYDDQNNIEEKEIFNAFAEMFINNNGLKEIKVGEYYYKDYGDAMSKTKSRLEKSTSVTWEDIFGKKEKEGGLRLINTNRIKKVPATVRHEYKYDINKNNIEETIYLNDNSQFSLKKSLEYNENGDLIRDIRLSGSSRSITNYHQEYINNKKVIEIAKGSDGDVYLTETWHYDEKGNLLLNVYILNNSFNVTSQVFDEHDNIIEISGPLSDSKKIIEYDSKNNWIKKTTYNNGSKIPSYQTQRKIEYY